MKITKGVLEKKKLIVIQNKNMVLQGDINYRDRLWDIKNPIL